MPSTRKRRPQAVYQCSISHRPKSGTRHHVPKRRWYVHAGVTIVVGVQAQGAGTRRRGDRSPRSRSYDRTPEDRSHGHPLLSASCFPPCILQIDFARSSPARKSHHIHTAAVRMCHLTCPLIPHARLVAPNRLHYLFKHASRETWRSRLEGKAVIR